MRYFSKKRMLFPLALLIYALMGLVAIAIGLNWLWNYADAYQKSRPDTALNAYIDKLNSDYVVARCDSLINEIDPNIQTQQQCRQVLQQALKDTFSCTKKVSLSTENHHVYTIRCGAQIIGTMEMESNGQNYGTFTGWQVTKESFDMSYLLTKPISVTVPHDYTVQSFGNTLGESYITQKDIPYSLLQAFYEDYAMPHMVTYTAGPFLGEGELVVLNPQGQEIAIDEISDKNTLLNNCSRSQEDALEKSVTAFVGGYIDYTSRNGGDTQANYTKLSKLMVKDSPLAKKMHAAMESFNWIDDRHAIMLSQKTDYYVNIGGGKYFCDVTYTVEFDILYGRTTQSTHAQIIFSETENGLLAEAMRIL